MSLRRAEAKLSASAPVFAALGDATRLRLVARLCTGGPASIAGLTESVDVTRQAVTKHLHVLENAGVREETAREAMRLASHKLPCSTRIVEKIREAV